MSEVLIESSLFFMTSLFSIKDCQVTVAGDCLAEDMLIACNIDCAMSTLQVCRLFLKSSASVSHWLNQAIHINSQQRLYFSGTVTHIHCNHSQSPAAVELTAHCLLYPLSLHTPKRIFTDKTASEIIQKLLKPYPIQTQLRLKDPEYALNLFTQYQHSDYDCLKQITAHSGIYFYWAHDKLIMTDHLKKTNPIQLPYIKQAYLKAKSACIVELTHTHRLTPKTLHFLDYNPRTAHLRIQTGLSNPKQTTGRWITLNNAVNTQSAQQHIARCHLERLQQSDHQIRCKTTDRRLTLGAILDIDNQSYQIIAIKHCINKAYYNDCTLIPCTLTFRAKLPKKRYVGFQTATVFSKHSNIPNVDQQGQYQIQMPYQHKPIRAHYVRINTHFTGDQFGHHFPLPNQSKVLLTYLNGDINQPLILGSLSDARNPNIVTQHNSTEHKWQTAKQQMLCLDAQARDPAVMFHNDQQRLHLCANPQTARLSSEDGRMHITTEQSLLHKSQQAITQTIGNKTQVVAHRHIQHHADNIGLHNSAQSIETQSAQTAQLQTQILTTESHTHALQSPNIQLNSTQFHSQSQNHASNSPSIKLNAAKKLTLTCQNSRIVWEHTGKLTLNSQSIVINSATLKTNLSKIGFNGT